MPNLDLNLSGHPTTQELIKAVILWGHEMETKGKNQPTPNLKDSESKVAELILNLEESIIY